MSEEPKIPFGFKRVFGHSCKGDGRWNGTRFEKVKKEYPFISEEQVVIRKCRVEQIDLIPAAADTGAPQPPTLETMDLE